MGCVDEMKSIRFKALYLGYDDLADAAEELILADPPVLKQHRLNLLDFLNSAMRAREENRVAESHARSRRIFGLYNPERIQFRVVTT